MQPIRRRQPAARTVGEDRADPGRPRLAATNEVRQLTSEAELAQTRPTRRPTIRLVVAERTTGPLTNGNTTPTVETACTLNIQRRKSTTLLITPTSKVSRSNEPCPATSGAGSSARAELSSRSGRRPRALTITVASCADGYTSTTTMPLRRGHE